MIEHGEVDGDALVVGDLATSRTDGRAREQSNRYRYRCPNRGSKCNAMHTHSMHLFITQLGDIARIATSTRIPCRSRKESQPANHPKRVVAMGFKNGQGT